MVKEAEKLTPERLRRIRERLGITQAEAAKRVGVSRRTWEGWEWGKPLVSGPAIMLIEQMDSQSSIQK